MKSNKTNCTVSEIVATARIYALISVLCAHLTFDNSVVGFTFGRIGTIGVIVFLISSGYYFIPAKFKSYGELIKKKSKSICIPWLVLGSLVWVYNIILSSKFRSPMGYLKWIFGNGTFLYYVPMLLLCFLLLYKASQKTLISAIVINIASVLLTATGVLEPVIEALHITNFLNVFNWIGYFALGMLLQKINEKNIVEVLLKIRWLVIALFICCVVLAVLLKNVNFTYFSYVAIPYQLLGCMAVFSLSTLPLVRTKICGYLSECSYAIYLTHMVFIGLLDSILAKTLFLQIMSPLIIIMILFVVFMIGATISKKIKLDKIYCLLTGLRIKL